MALSLEISEELFQVVVFGPSIRCVEPGKALRLEDALFYDVIVEGLGPPELPVCLFDPGTAGHALREGRDELEPLSRG